MTDREKAIVMAHTGICMLTGNKFQIFHKYVEDIMDRPIMTHEIGWLADAIKEKSNGDFIALCADESRSESPIKWIPVSERLPEKSTWVLVTCETTDGDIFLDINLINQYTGLWDDDENCIGTVLAWMPLPQPYEPQESEE